MELPTPARSAVERGYRAALQLELEVRTPAWSRARARYASARERALRWPRRRLGAWRVA